MLDREHALSESMRRVSVHHKDGAGPSTSNSKMPARWRTYTDDGYMKAKLSGRCAGAPSAQALKKWLGGRQRLLADDPSLLHLSPLLSPASFVVDGYIGLGVPIGTDAFIQHLVKCWAIMEDFDKLGSIQDGFIQYQLLRFCQATRLQYLNGHIDLANQNMRQQQHVDHKIANALL
jgi:hypothetical protein